MWKIFIKELNFLYHILNATFLFLGSLSYALRAQVNMTHKKKFLGD
jgi:hypothetical protein